MNSYVVLARKYRPQVFDDVLGQGAVSVTIKNALESRRLAHAYLFTGPRGVGKTTMARLLAKALNCGKGPTSRPCGECPSCREVALSSSIDVLEMDAASHTGVDNVREVIIETVALAPSRDRYKVFIIDEAHMLSTAAFNALLKTLEEPPPHVVFVLATTESAKIPATIASRCQRFKFRPIAVDVLVAHLGALARKEKIVIEDEALTLLARSAGGSLRDAVSLLDQSHTFSDGAITADSIREMFGFVPQDMLMGTAQALLGKDAPALARWLQKIYEEGVEPAQLLRDLREAFEAVYLQKQGIAASIGALGESANQASAEAIGSILRRINKALEETRFSDSPRLTLELGLFGCLEAAGDLREWVARLEELERRLSSGAAPMPMPAPAPVARPTAPLPAPPPAAAPATASGLWESVLRAMGDKPALAASLAKARLVLVSPGEARLIFSRDFDLKTAQRSQPAIEAILATSAGKPIRLKLETGEAPAAAAFTEADGTAAPPGPGRVPEGEPWQGEEGDAPKDSALKKAEKILGGTVKFIKKKT